MNEKKNVFWQLTKFKSNVTLRLASAQFLENQACQDRDSFDLCDDDSSGNVPSDVRH